ncbi:MAG: ComEA family DNA-binding protein [Anaerolineales bacterium]|nr:ComEA family DNA-binding protein [Anaerolineales bacterium]
MKSFWTAAFGVVIGLLAAGLLWLVGRPPRGEPVLLMAPPSPSPLVVQVSGAVAQPGLYRLPVGSRLADAIEAAGGALPDANTLSLNLARLLEDGQAVRVPTSMPPPAVSMFTATPEATPTPYNPFININTATPAELESLPGIGPVLAQRIIAYREKHGAFAAIEDVQQVYGVNADTFAMIEDFISVGEE